jgi:hypothetical protein
MREYLERGHEEEYPCCLCIRVTLRDMRTGKMAVVWEDNKGEARYVHDVDDDEGYAFGGVQRSANAIGRLVGQNDAYLYTRPVVGQGEAVSMQDRLYHVQPRDRLLLFCFDYFDSVSLEQFIGALQAVMT